MNAFTEFAQGPLSNTILMTMVVTSGLAALPKPPDKPTSRLGIAYKFAYDWATGFWSLKTGQQRQEAHIVTSQQTALSSITQDATIPVNPPQPKE